MEIQKLSKKFMVRKLNDIDIDKIYEVMHGNTLYFQYCPPMATDQSIADDILDWYDGMKNTVPTWYSK